MKIEIKNFSYWKLVAKYKIEFYENFLKEMKTTKQYWLDQWIDKRGLRNRVTFWKKKPIPDPTEISFSFENYDSIDQFVWRTIHFTIELFEERLEFLKNFIKCLEIGSIESVMLTDKEYDILTKNPNSKTNIEFFIEEFNKKYGN